MVRHHFVGSQAKKTWDNIVKRRKTCASEIGVHKIHRPMITNKNRRSEEEEEC
jgi:hypothetical protein